MVPLGPECGILMRLLPSLQMTKGLLSARWGLPCAGYLQKGEIGEGLVPDFRSLLRNHEFGE